MRIRHFVMLGGVVVAMLLLRQYMGVSTGSSRQASGHKRRKPFSQASENLWVLATFTDGRSLGEGLHVLVSDHGMDGGSWDGRQWREAPGDPLLFTPERDASGLAWQQLGGLPAVFRDPSIVYHAGAFHMVFTSELCAGLSTRAFHCDRRRWDPGLPARFGYARSRDLVTWEASWPVPVRLEGACNVWAPELYVLDKAEAASDPLLSGMVALAIFSTTVARGGDTHGCPWDFGPSAGSSRHQVFYMATADFGTWSTPRQLFDTGESAIDTVLLRVPADRASCQFGQPFGARS